MKRTGPKVKKRYLRQDGVLFGGYSAGHVYRVNAYPDREEVSGDVARDVMDRMFPHLQEAKIVDDYSGPGWAVVVTA